MSEGMDRDAFGNWLSGFVDGEGHFCLLMQKFNYKDRYDYYIPNSKFSIGLRSDDDQILKDIKSFLGCGTMCYDFTHRNGVPTRRSTLNINRIDDLFKIMVPHFDRYPLRAKKKRDFGTWKLGVELCRRVSLRPFSPIPGKRGCYPKWKTDEINEFKNLIQILRDTRKFTESPVASVSIAKIKRSPHPLFNFEESDDDRECGPVSDN